MRGRIEALFTRSGESADPLVLFEDAGVRAVSLADSGAILRAKDFPGHCTERFKANILTLGVDYSRLSPGTAIRIGEAVLTVSAVGKHCHAVCAAAGSPDCPLRYNCAFASVEKGGTIGLIDYIELGKQPND